MGHGDLAAIEISDAGRFRDFLFDRGMSSSSVKRVSSTVRAIVNLAIREQGIAVSNVFSVTYIFENALKQKRPPIPMDTLRQAQSNCRSLNDEPRWLIALISDTGMRLSEACGLLVSDIYLDTTTPYIDLVEHPWRRLNQANGRSP